MKKKIGVNIARKTISLSPATLKLAQEESNKYFGGNISAYIAALVTGRNYCNNCARDNFYKVQNISANIVGNVTQTKTDG